MIHSDTTNSNMTMIFLILNVPAGSEPGSPISEADAMTTAPRRQGTRRNSVITVGSCYQEEY
jgi:hypothetical protein